MTQEQINRANSINTRIGLLNGFIEYSDLNNKPADYLPEAKMYRYYDGHLRREWCYIPLEYKEGLLDDYLMAQERTINKMRKEIKKLQDELDKL